MTASQYRQKTRKVETLPSGLQVSIRSMVISDFVEVENIPSAFFRGQTEKAKEEIQANPKVMAAMIRTVLLNCVSIVSDPRQTVVDKEPDACGDNEFSYRDFTPQDANVCLMLATGQSIPKEAAQEAASKFPEEPQAT